VHGELYYSYFDGTSWAPQQVIPGVASSRGAALTGYGARLYAMWKGAGADQNLWFSSFDGTWAPQALGPGSSGPDAPSNVGVRIQYQETSHWCWIAVAASIAHFYDPNSPATQGAMMTAIGRQLNNFPSSVDCSGDAAVQAAHPDLAAPTWGPYLAWSTLQCGFWPAASNNAPMKITAPGSGPIVVLGTTRDPATPYKWAQSLASQLQNGHLVTFDGDGLTAYMRS